MDAFLNWSRSILRSAYGSRAGKGVSPSRTFPEDLQSPYLNESKLSSFRRTPKPARYKRALSKRLLRWPLLRSLAMPGLRDILNTWFADVIHQRESQCVCVWPAELIHARACATFGNCSFSASLLNCHGIAGNRIGAPDLCFWLGSCRVKRSVGIDRPNRAE